MSGIRGGHGYSINASSVEFTLPGSDEYPMDMFHARRGMVGGSLARCWVSFNAGGSLIVVDFAHNGSSADPRTWVSSLVGATRAPVSLAAGNRTATQVGDAVVTALVVVGIQATNAAGTITIPNARTLVIPATVDTTDRSLRGMWGLQRDDWGAGVGVTQPNQNGGTDGTGTIHLPALSTHTNIPAATNGRVIGVYVWAHGGFTPRLAAGTGPVYALDPATITIIGEAQVSSGISNAEFGGVIFSAPGAIDTDDELWAMYKGDVATSPGGPRFRTHGRVVEGNGDIVVDEELCWDTTVDDAATTLFGATYDPTNNSNFSTYPALGLIYEIEDTNGNFYANGAIDDWIGDQNTDDTHGTQFAAAPATLDDETTHHRFLWPQWQSAPVTQVRRAYDAVDLVGANAEDSRICYYTWPDLDFPSSVDATLVADAGLQGVDTENAYNTVTLASSVDLGVGAVGANQYISLGWNYVTSDGTVLSTMTLPVFVDEETGDDSWTNCWVDDRENWHDDIPGASGLNAAGTARAPSSGVTEYRTTDTGMPHDSWAQTWPATFITDGTDDSPNAIALEASRVQRAGIVAA